MSRPRVPAIDISDLCVRRGNKDVLPSLTLSILSGALVGLLGPSGSGKSTLIRAIVGAQVIAGGTVTVLGLPSGHRALRRRVGYVTQAPSVYADLTVRENLRYFAALLSVPEAIVDATIASVGLNEQSHQLVSTLSGGQTSRVSLAAALLGEPDLLVLDEPTVGLDPVLRNELWALFRNLTERGTTVVVSSHVMDEASRCDRLVFLREGRVIAHDTLEQIQTTTRTADAEAAFLALAARDQSS